MENEYRKNIRRFSTTFKIGDPIYYHSQPGDTFPGAVLAVKNNRVKIFYNHFFSDRVSWVLKRNIELQN